MGKTKKTIYLDILGHKTAVTLTSDQNDLVVGNRNREGLFYPHSNEILINADMCADRTLSVLIHEILHAIENTVNIELKEECVEALGMGLFQVIKANKKFIKEIVRKMK